MAFFSKFPQIDNCFSSKETFFIGHSHQARPLAFCCYNSFQLRPKETFFIDRLSSNTLLVMSSQPISPSADLTKLNAWPIIAQHFCGKSEKQRQKQQRIWLQPELIYELLLFMQPDKVWSVRRLLRISAIFYRLISGSKKVENWRKPHSVLDRFLMARESEYSYKILKPLDKYPVLMRRFSAEGLPFTSIDPYTANSYFKLDETSEGPGSPNRLLKFQVLVLLAKSSIPEKNGLLCKRLNSKGAKSVMMEDYGVDHFRAVSDPANEYVMVEVGFVRNFADPPFYELGAVCATMKGLLSFLTSYVENKFPRHLK
ncbi:hypothetical protein niasHS_004426 [Heterodera schachtii]|uniref:Uncharacterized protein n=1 Tax=Heterodera schachtii TaxID=97005 RepID=A0ABD2JR31_HETSC